MSYLLDTCVISEMMARKQNTRVLAWIDSREETSLYLSVITVGEIRKGIEKLPGSLRRADLRQWLYEILLARFSGRLLALDVDTMLRWGQLVGSLETQGRPVPAIDSLIAASALEHNLTLVTRNESDFAATGVEIINPWRLADP